jgi:hypothetical protein
MTKSAGLEIHEVTINVLLSTKTSPTTESITCVKSCSKFRKIQAPKHTHTHPYEDIGGDSQSHTGASMSRGASSSTESIAYTHSYEDMYSNSIPMSTFEGLSR